MGKITEQNVWNEDIYSLELSDPVVGGTPEYVDGVPVVGFANAATQQLANRTLYLKFETEEALALANAAIDAIVSGGWPVFATEAEGRAAVADGDYFQVIGSGEVSIYVYRRDSSSASTLVASYPSVEFIRNVDKELTAALITVMETNGQGSEFYNDDDPAAQLVITDEVGNPILALDEEMGLVTQSKAEFFNKDEDNHTFAFLDETGSPILTLDEEMDLVMQSKAEFHNSDESNTEFAFVDEELKTITTSGGGGSGFDPSTLPTETYGLEDGAPYIGDEIIRVMPTRNEMWTTYPEDWLLNYPQLIDWWEDLRAEFPEYITRRALTAENGTITTGSDGVSIIYEYTMKPPRLKNESNNIGVDHMWSEAQRAAPKIALVAGIHGNEESGMMSLMLLADQMFRHWQEDSFAREFRFNYQIVCIPYLNPWGLNQSPSQRMNANGVDLNRNYDSDWANAPGGSNPGDSNYKGPSAGSENETKISVEWAQGHSDALFFVDMHRFGATWFWGFTSWMGTRKVETLEKMKKALFKTKADFDNHFPYLIDGANAEVRCGGNEPGAQAHYWQEVMQVPGYLLEGTTSLDQYNGHGTPRGDAVLANYMAFENLLTFAVQK